MTQYLRYIMAQLEKGSTFQKSLIGVSSLLYTSKFFPVVEITGDFIYVIILLSPSALDVSGRVMGMILRTGKIYAKKLFGDESFALTCLSKVVRPLSCRKGVISL